MTGFPKWSQLVGDNLCEMAKNCMKIRKLTFLGRKSGWEGGTWVGQANISGIVGCGDLAKLVFRIPFMTVKSKWQIASQAKQGCSENSKFSKSFNVKYE